MKYFIPFLLLFVFISSCKDDEIEDPVADFGYEYFPLEVGKYKEYKIDSTLFDGGLVRVYSTSYRREETVSMDVDLEGEAIYTMHVFVKPTLDAPWVQTGVVTEKRSLTQAERSADNLRFIKISFPFRNGSTWNGNAFISSDLEYTIVGEPVRVFEGWTGNYEVNEEPTSLTIDTLVFDNTMRVLETNEDNTLGLRESFAYYAPNVGLVKRTQRILGLNCNGTNEDPCHDPNVPWEDDAESGYSMTQTIIGFN